MKRIITVICIVSFLISCSSTESERIAIYEKQASVYPSRCGKEHHKSTNSLSSPSTKVDLTGSPTRKEPRYPPKAARLGLEGFVTFEFDISEQGKVINPNIIRSYPEDVFHKEAMRAFSQWTYKPTGKIFSCAETSLYFLLAD